MNAKVFFYQGQALTVRERDVWKMLAESHTTKAIAGVLGLSNKTVEWHRAKLSKKLGAHDLAALTRLAIRHKLTTA